MTDFDLLAEQGEDTGVVETEPALTIFDAVYIGADQHLSGRYGEARRDADGSIWFETPERDGSLKVYQSTAATLGSSATWRYSMPLPDNVSLSMLPGCGRPVDEEGFGDRVLAAIAGPHSGDITEGRKIRKAVMDCFARELSDLTPGGSEFVGDPERCIEWIKERRDSTARTLIQQQKTNKQLREDLDAANQRAQKAEAPSGIAKAARRAGSVPSGLSREEERVVNHQHDSLLGLES